MKEPVTTIVKNKPKIGRERECLDWMLYTSSKAEQFSGFIDKEIYRSAEGEKLFMTVFTFDSKENLEAWEKSTVRNSLVEQGREFVESFAVKNHFTGLELFLSGSSLGKPTPIRWKIFLLTVVVLFILFNSLVPAISAVLDLWPLYPQIKSLLTLTIVVGTMTFLVMPLLTRRLHSWLTR
jgi:antibiotic biosynthesis monooxygenase (ABM) superfamily enzyme